DGSFRAVVGDRVVAGARSNDVRAARTINGVAAGAAGNRVRRGGTDDRHGGRQRGGIDVLEVGDVGGIARGLVGVAEIDDRGRVHQQGVGASAAVDGNFAAAVRDAVIACAGRNHVAAAAAVDAVIAGAGRDRIGRRGAGNGQGRAEGRRVHI